MTEPDDDQNRPVTPRANPAPVWPSTSDDHGRGAPLAPRRFALTAAELSADYPSFDANDGDLPRVSFFAKHRLAVRITALVVVFLLLVAGAAALGYTAGQEAAANVPAPVEPARAVPAIVPAAVPVRTCSVSGAATAAQLGTLHAQVTRADNGEVLFSRLPDAVLQPGSAAAVITAAAAVAKLGADFQLTTTVVDSTTPGTIVLVGRGDATLSSLPEGQQSVYADAPSMSTLAAATLTTYQAAHPDVPITNVVLDATYWDKADRWNSGWDRDLQTGGTLSEVTALQVDGDRADPTAQTSARSTDPIGRAGEVFVQALGLNPDAITVSEGAAETGAPVLAEVSSQPLSTLVGQMLLQNDATLAEMLARVLSVESEFSGSAASLQQAIPQALQGLGLATGELTVRDGSGLSRDNSVSAQFMASVMAAVASNEAVATVLTSLSVAGETGTLAARFADDSAPAVGAISGVAGSLDGSRSLAGVISAPDGTVLSFSLIAVGGGVADDADAALDTLAASLYGCGNNLSNF
ncbi:D-alanyl-D-alanine carboxypeptidase/D-alanyl-D-alanine endopeptidase [Glaciihabitans tibetensis]|uniref:D-alanyl-D-alanine carboxypeptidase/D-alanyl-D-alanine endopeptidase n=1 Tax=Glaciihabitans tibetensis TaxID=1266600 RepID=UPI0011B268E1|nr:D-alanyl-D-alanine carboxypeptidase/D-alanyl-D-alanine-endopeptidase [Glaciihabitans tibetensis]